MNASENGCKNDRVKHLLVKRGDRVQANQVIAILESHDRLQSALLEAQERVSVAQAKLAQVKVRARAGEIAAQQAEQLPIAVAKWKD